MKYAESVVDLIGDTPLVRLNRVTEGVAATVLAKLEYLNPGGSSKDRIATRIIDAAERDGLLQPGGTIVEPTSGNTGVGTGGTITGTGRYLREISADRASGRVQIVGVDPVGSVYSGGTGQPYLVEGVGEDFWPEAYDPAVTDRIVAVSDQQSFDMTLRLAREEGLLVGGSCGMAVVGALEVARELGPDDVVVVLLPDGGRGYLGKIFNEGWMLRHGFTRATGSPTVADLLGTPRRALAHLRREHTVADAVAALEHQAGALPVVAAAPPVVLGEVLGAVDSRTLLRALASGAVTPADPITAAMGPMLPVVGAHESLESAGERFGDRGAGGQHPDTLLVLDGGNPIGLLTRADLITALAGGRS